MSSDCFKQGSRQVQAVPAHWGKHGAQQAGLTAQRHDCTGRQLAFVLGRRASLKVLASPESTLVCSMPSGGRSLVMKWSVPPYRLRWVIRWSPDLQHSYELLCNQSWESGVDAGHQHGV